jgi:hypothetical protein
MAKFRKKPIVIEAIQYHDWMRKQDQLPEGVYIVPWDDGDQPVVHTLEDDIRVMEGDWIIKIAAGQFYPCKPDIFEQNYEPVE